MTYLHFDWLFVLLRRNPQSDYRQRRLPVVVGGGLCSDTGRPSGSLCVRFIRNADDPPDHNEQNLPGETVALISDRDLTFVNNVWSSFLFFLVLFASWGTWQLLHHLVVIAVCALRLTSIFMNPTCREWRRVPASQSTSFTVVYTLLRVWWWFLWFLFVHFWFTEKKTHKGNRTPLYFCFPFDIYSRMYLNFHVVSVCLCGWVCGVPYDWTDYLFISRFPSHINMLRWFQRVSSRRFHKPGVWSLKARVGRLSDSVWTPLFEELGSLLIQKVSQTQYRWIEKWCVDDDEVLCVWRPLSFHLDCCLMSVLTPSHFGPSCSGSRLKSPVGVCLRRCVIDSRSFLTSTTRLLLAVCGSHRHAAIKLMN